MNAPLEQAYELYTAARQAMDAGDLAEALRLLEQSLDLQVHHKTLELIGDLRCQLGQHRDAIVPLAAATGLNRGIRAPLLLAEAFAALGEWANAEVAAMECLRRDANCRRAQIILENARTKSADN